MNNEEIPKAESTGDNRRAEPLAPTWETSADQAIRDSRNGGSNLEADRIAAELALGGSPDPDYVKRVREWFENRGRGAED